jgi:hypothetical protein
VIEFRVSTPIAFDAAATVAAASWAAAPAGSEVSRSAVGISVLSRIEILQIS